MAQLIEHSEVNKWMASIHPDWVLDETFRQISRNFTFKDYYQTMAFANSVAWIAHQNEHHPEMHISYKSCLIEYSTHSAGGLSEQDFYCAKAIDDLLER
jgi:4a-hydroxytetrahydrobiopterin dehydratase